MFTPQNKYVYLPIPDKAFRAKMTRMQYICKVTARQDTLHVRRKYKNALGVWIHRDRLQQLRQLRFPLPPIVVRQKAATWFCCFMLALFLSSASGAIAKGNSNVGVERFTGFPVGLMAHQWGYPTIIRTPSCDCFPRRTEPQAPVRELTAKAPIPYLNINISRWLDPYVWIFPSLEEFRPVRDKRSDMWPIVIAAFGSALIAAGVMITPFAMLHTKQEWHKT